MAKMFNFLLIKPCSESLDFNRLKSQDLKYDFYYNCVKI